MADNFNGRLDATTSGEMFLTPHPSRTRDVGVGIGDGDSDAVVGAGAGTGRQTKSRFRKFGNGVRIPVFYETSDHEDGHIPSHGVDRNNNPKRTNPSSQTSLEGPPPIWGGTFPELTSTEATEIMELFKCTICQDFMVEATAASCGHTFCSACLDAWIKLKPICPICSKRVSCRIRLFNEDLLIEKMVNRCEDFPQEIAESLYEASKSRMDREHLSRSSLAGKIREKVDDLTNSLRCKGFWQCFKNSGPVQAMARFWTERRSQPEAPVQPSRETSGGRFGATFYPFFIGIIVGGLLVKGYIQFDAIGTGGVTNFLRYVYLSIKHYDGSIPDYLKQDGTGMVGDQMKSQPDDINGGLWWNPFYNLYAALIK